MAAVLRANADGTPVTILETTFETYQPDRPADLVVSAQAFHWVDPRLRYSKAASVLRPGGALALLRNDKADLDPDLHAELDRAYAEHLPQSRHRDASHVHAEITAEIDASACFGPVEVRTAPWTESYSTADYLRLLETYSDHAILDPSHKTPLHAAIAAAIDRRGGTITIPFVAALHLARVTPRG